MASARATWMDDRGLKTRSPARPGRSALDAGFGFAHWRSPRPAGATHGRQRSPSDRCRDRWASRSVKCSSPPGAGGSGVEPAGSGRPCDRRACLSAAFSLLQPRDLILEHGAVFRRRQARPAYGLPGRTARLRLSAGRAEGNPHRLCRSCNATGRHPGGTASSAQAVAVKAKAAMTMANALLITVISWRNRTPAIVAAFTHEGKGGGQCSAGSDRSAPAWWRRLVQRQIACRRTVGKGQRKGHIYRRFKGLRLVLRFLTRQNPVSMVRPASRGGRTVIAAKPRVSEA